MDDETWKKESIALTEKIMTVSMQHIDEDEEWTEKDAYEVILTGLVHAIVYQCHTIMGLAEDDCIKAIKGGWKDLK